MNPKYVKVKCGSHVIINKKLEAGCDHSTFQGPEYVEKMLKYSMGMPEWGTEPIEAFNEVLVDSSAYLTNLPRSVEGFVMIGGPSESDQARLRDEPPGGTTCRSSSGAIDAIPSRFSPPHTDNSCTFRRGCH